MALPEQDTLSLRVPNQYSIETVATIIKGFFCHPEITKPKVEFNGIKICVGVILLTASKLDELGIQHSESLIQNTRKNVIIGINQEFSRILIVFPFSDSLKEEAERLAEVKEVDWPIAKQRVAINWLIEYKVVQPISQEG